MTGISGGSSSGYAVDADGIAWSWGNNNVGNLGDGTTDNETEPVPVAGLSNVIRIDSGSTAGTGGLRTAFADIEDVYLRGVRAEPVVDTFSVAQGQ